MIRGGKGGRLLEGGLRRIADAGGLVVDLGTPQRFFKALRPYEALFKNVEYRAYGYEPRMDFGAYNCDGHQDIENLTLENESVNAVICIDVLEHVADPFKAASEIVRVLRPGGQLLIAVPFQYSYHGKDGGSHSHESYPDYWRMTHSGLAHLFRDLSETEVTPTDGPIEFKLRQLYLSRFVDSSIGRTVVDAIDRPKPGRSTSGHLLLGRK